MCLKFPAKYIFKILNGANLILLSQYIKLNLKKYLPKIMALP